MADHTHIEWTDATWNPITGCSVVSAGCKHCYAMKLAGTRLQHHPSRAGLTVETKAGPVWNGQVRLNEAWLDQPLRWRRPRRIFVCAHGDLFHENVPDQWIDAVFAVMCLAPQHSFQVLTKRADRMRAYCTSSHTLGRVLKLATDALAADGEVMAYNHDDGLTGILLPNVWLGVSVEDQAAADERIPLLLQTPAAVRWVSAEPLLGPVRLPPAWVRPQRGCGGTTGGVHHHDEFCSPRLDWVVAGGESGTGARPMHPDWARSLRDQCAEAGVPFMFKQWGAWGQYVNEDHYTHGGEEKHAHAWVDRDTAISGLCWLDDDDGGWSNWTGDPPMINAEDLAPTVAVMGHFGKKAAGRLLDGVLHDAYPEARP
jgi:protein gp37